MRLTSWLLFFAIVPWQYIFAISPKDIPDVPAVITQQAFDYEGSHFVVKLIPSENTTIRPGGIPGAVEPEEGDFLLATTPAIALYSDSEWLTQIGVQYMQVERHKSDQNWNVLSHPPLFLLERKDKPPLIVLTRYGASTWMEYSVYFLEREKDQFTIKAVEFVGPSGSACPGQCNNVLYTEDIEMSYVKDRHHDVLRIKGYDNSLEGFFTSQFIEEFQARTWRCVGHHSDMTQDEILEDD